MADIPFEIDLINAALAKFGGGAIADFEEETDLADVCQRLAPPLIDKILARDWQQLRRTFKLDKLAESPVNGWRYAYAYPVNTIGGPRRITATPTVPDQAWRDYAIEGRTIYASRDPLYAIFTQRLSPDQWLPELRSFVITALAAELVIPVCEDKDLAAQFHAAAWGTPQMNGQGGLFAAAMHEDALLAPKHVPLGMSVIEGSVF